MSNEGAPRRKRGCLFYGCLSAIVVSLLVVAVFIAGYFVAKRTVNRLITDYTDTVPQPIEVVSYEPAERDALNRRLASFREALEAGQGAQELVLSAADLNALVAENAELKGKLFVIIEDDKIQGRVSMPLKDIGPLKLNGRHLNGMATFKVALTNGLLDVRLEEMQVKNKSLPTVIETELKKQNLAKDYQNDPRQQAELRKFESIRIQDGKVFLKSKGGE